MYYITLGFSEEEMVHTLIKRFEFDPAKAAEVAKQVILLQEKGDTQDTFSGEGEEEKGDIQGQEKVTPGAEKVTLRVQKDDIAMSPESSLTVIEPSEENRQKDADSFLKKQERTDDDELDEPNRSDQASGSTRSPGGADLQDSAGAPLPTAAAADHGALPPNGSPHSEGGEETPDALRMDLDRATASARAEAGGAWATPPPAGGDDAAAHAGLVALHEAKGGSPPRVGTGTYVKELEAISQALRDRAETDPEIAILAAQMFVEEKSKLACPHYKSFVGDYGEYLGRARGQLDDAPDRRARDVEAMEASLAALEERMAARPPPVEGDSVWESAKRELALQMTGATFNAWVRRTYGLGQEDGVYTVVAPNALARDWLDNRLKTTAQRTLVGILGGAVEVRFEAAGAPEEAES